MEVTAEVSQKHKDIPIEPRSSIYLIREGRETPLTQTQETWVKARQNLLGPDSRGEVTREQLTQLVNAGIAEVSEAITKAGASGTMANRGETFLGALQSNFQDAKDVLEGRRSSPRALEAVIDHATQEELKEGQARGKEITRAAKTGIGLSKDGAVYVEAYPKTGLGEHSKADDIKKGEELPIKVQDRAAQVKAFVRDNFSAK